MKLLTGLLLLAAAQGQAANFSTSYDEFSRTKYTTCSTFNMQEPDGGYGRIRLDPVRVEPEGEPPSYLLNVFIRSSYAVVVVPSADALLLLVDGQRFALEGTKGHRRRPTAGVFEETFVAELDSKLFETLAGAKTVKARVQGAARFVTADAADVVLEDWRQCLAALALASPPTGQPL